MEEKFNKIMEGLLERLNKIEDFTLEKLPDLCKEIVELRRIEIQNSMIANTFSLAISLSLALACAFIFHSVNFELREHVYEKATSEWTFIHIATSAVGTVLLIASWIIAYELLTNFLALRQLKAAPKLFVVRQLKRLISK